MPWMTLPQEGHSPRDGGQGAGMVVGGGSGIWGAHALAFAGLDFGLPFDLGNTPTTSSSSTSTSSHSSSSSTARGGMTRGGMTYMLWAPK